MKKQFGTMEVVRQLGVAPSTGSVIAALLNGELNPDHYRGLQRWPLEDMDAPVPVRKVMKAVADLLGLDPVTDMVTLKGADGEILAIYLRYVDGQPTVVWDAGVHQYLLETREEMFNTTE